MVSEARHLPRLVDACAVLSLTPVTRALMQLQLFYRRGVCVQELVLPAGDGRAVQWQLQPQAADESNLRLPVLPAVAARVVPSRLDKRRQPEPVTAAAP